MVSEPTDETLTQIAIRLKEYRNIRIDKIMKIGMFKQALCKVIVSLLPDCITGVDIVSYWETFPLANIVKQKAYKFTPQAILIRHVKEEKIFFIE